MILMDLITLISRALSGTLGSPGGLVIKNPPASAGDTGSIPGSGRSDQEEEMAAHSRILEPG